MIPTNKDWATMRQMLRQVMQDTIEIYNVSTSNNEWGTPTTTRTLATTTKGQLSAASGNERKLAESLGAINNVITGEENIEIMHLVLPYGTSLALTQEVKSPDGKYWQVVQVGSSQTYTAALEATLMRKIVNDEVQDE